MFHANAWAITFIAPMAGCKLVMPGAKLDGQSIYELLETEKVTFTVGPYKLILPVGVQVDDGSMHVGSRVNGMFVSVYARRP